VVGRGGGDRDLAISAIAMGRIDVDSTWCYTK
jgi:hypothetical protein